MRTPVSTYRLQITAGFDLFAAARTLPYLHDLGVDWVYLSPLLEAEPGSDHGYDVVAHDRVDPARGGAEGLAALSAEARRLGMGVLVDIVPNHVGVATPRLNAWWWDLLTHGRSSRHAAAFDVDWDVGGGRLRIPVVGDDDMLPTVGSDSAVGASSCATTTTATRSLPARRRSRSSTTSWSRGGSPTTGSTTGASSRSTPWRGSASRTARSSTSRTWRSAAGSTRGSSTGCASTTPTASATLRRTSTTWRS